MHARWFLRPRATQLAQRRLYATGASRHAQWYSDIVPSMIPIFLLGSAIYLGLELTQVKLAQEKFMDESAKRIEELENEIASLREKHLTQATTPSSASPPDQNPSTKKRSWW